MQERELAKGWKCTHGLKDASVFVPTKKLEQQGTVDSVQVANGARKATNMRSRKQRGKMTSDR